MEQNSKCQVENGVPQQANTSTSHLSLMGNHAMSTLLEEKSSSLTSAASNNSSRLEQLGQTGDFSQPDVIQGMFTVTIADTIEKSYLSADAWDRLNLLQQILQTTYGNLYDQQWNIILDLSRTTIGTPAYTNYIEGPADGDNDNITVTFSRWFLERCSFGELLGMANHELNVHFFPDIAFASYFSAKTRQTRNYPNDYFEKEENYPTHRISESMVIKAYKTTNCPINYSGEIASTVNVTKSDFIDEGLYDFDNEFCVAFEDTKPKVTPAPPETTVKDGEQNGTAVNNPKLELKLKSPHTIRENGGQRDHAYMSHIRVIPNEVFFSPRAAIYAQMSLHALDSYITSYESDDAKDPGSYDKTKNEAVKILGYYFLDIARTWAEGIKAYTINPFKAMVSDQIGPDVLEMTMRYYHWMIDSNGNPNSELMQTPSSNTILVLKDTRTDMENYLSRLNQQLRSLMWRAALSEGIGVGRLTKDLVAAPFTQSTK